ncbi:peptide/nickel transport system substrate-binding protein [Actinoplanes tereljensis]|uniref:Peptide ABC transporter substrate-binding protein n=1 Tax=Paractinoplanes tereljensis TaxID=571912 RepID=A0A919NWG0_9ACTN|nr:ABC transporter substrate-binding protein [Actinoplanes tereljensis]GIF25211.1 peptide ABC transporter substrate-binding protein [Actinoplanes tereljensis]
MAGKTKVMVAAAAALTLGLTAACGGGSDDDNSNTSSSDTGAAFNASSTKVVNVSDKKGGTLNLWSPQDADSFDPAISYYAWTINMNRLYSRTLMTYTPKVGADGLILTPDLASAAPEVSADGKTYTFKLKSGLKFDDGTAITSKDVKYGIERIFAQDVVPGGPLYLIEELDQGQGYKGPYKDTDPNKLGLKTVETPDDSTIVFHLKAANANFPYELALPGGAPVPQKRDTGAKYGLAPASSGPYKFESIQPGKGATLVRNTNWDASTDPNRKALPDKITLTITTNAEDMDARLIAGTADMDASQSGVQTQARTQILTDEKLKANAANPNNGFIRYAAIVSKVAPFDNIECRKAVIYASDPTTLQTARGGPVAGGDIATNMLPPNILGADKSYDPYGRAQGKPQVDKAKAALTACGKPTGFDTKIAVRNNKPAEIATATALQAALKTVGINAAIEQYDGSQIATVAGSPNNVHKKGYGIIIAGWGADFPTGYGYLAPLAMGSFIAENGNFNFPEINDPAINDLFTKGLAEKDATAAAADYQAANVKVMDGYYFLPFVFDKALNYYNPRLTNVYFHSGLAMVDFASLGVSDGK